MKIFAHRGYSQEYPENTMIAFQMANVEYVAGIELDLHLTKDKVPVIIHDELVDRTTDKSGIVSQMTIDEIKECRIDVIEEIPTLEEYFDWVKNTHLLTNIELKTNVYHYEDIEKIVVELIEKYKLYDRIVISSFNHYSILKVKEELKRLNIEDKVKVGFLNYDWLIEPDKYLSKYKINTFHPLFTSLNRGQIEALHRENIEIYTYTVNDKVIARSLQEIGVDVLITNDINILKE